MNCIGIYTLSDEQMETASKNGISYGTLQRRLTDYEWDLERAISTPPEKYRKWNPKVFKVAAENGIHEHTVRTRVARGMSIKEAITKPGRGRL